MRNYKLSWSEFKAALQQEYDSPHIIASLQAELYGRRQPEDEDVRQFIQAKLNLFKRLDPTQDEVWFYPQIIELMLPDLKPYLRLGEFNTRERLLKAASQIYHDKQATRWTDGQYQNRRTGNHNPNIQTNNNWRHRPNQEPQDRNNPPRSQQDRGQQNNRGRNNHNDLEGTDLRQNSPQGNQRQEATGAGNGEGRQ